MNNKLALAVAVVLGILSIVGIKAYVEQMQKEMRYDTEEIPVLVASKDLGENHLLVEDDLATANFPRTTLQRALKNTWIKDSEKDSFLGGLTRSKVKEGQVLLHSHFYRRVTSKKLVFGDNERAVSVPIEQPTGLTGMLKPGDFVDVIMSMKLIEPLSGIELKVTWILLRHVLILATETNTNPHALVTGGYRNLTLRLEPKDVNKLIHCLNNGGKVYCSLTNDKAGPAKGQHPVVADVLYNEFSKELIKAIGRRPFRNR